MRKFLSLFVILTLMLSLTACAAAADKSKVKFDKRRLKKIELTMSPQHGSPMIVLRENFNDVPIFGEPVATQDQMINFINKRNPNPKLNCSVENIVHLYYLEAGREGIRPDIALCQAIKETGTWAYGGDVVPEQNNYCGLGTTGGGVKGAYFNTPQMGARAHVQHLLSYASKRLPSVEIVDPRYDLIKKFKPQIFGKLTNWTDLNGVWAVPGNHYGEDILQLWMQAQMPDASDASLDAADLKVLMEDDKASAYVYRGIVNYERGDFYGAYDDFKSALDVEPELKGALFNLAMTQDKLDKPKDAIKTYDKLLDIDEKFVDAWHNRARLKLQKKDYKGAIKDYERELKIETISPDAYNDIAVAYFRQKKYEEAWKYIQLAMSQTTTNAIVKDNYEKFSKHVTIKKDKRKR
ncbi:MAG: glucosaminidase domain-containing protein [Selenomonadaceae bacterium]|nr:glucosaminidase domain-containing protein [Selenomonadaceae bacterium]